MAPPLSVPPPPPRPESGSEFATRLSRSRERDRETSARDAILRGNYAPVSRTFKPIYTTANGHSGAFYVATEFLAVGFNHDYLVIPFTPGVGQQIADALNATLPTRKMADLTYANADVKLPFRAQTPRAGETRNSMRMVTEHQHKENADRAGRVGVIDGHKKYVVRSNLIDRNPTKVVIYGGWYSSGNRVQPLSAVHARSYLDYSHGIRLVRKDMIVDGRSMLVEDVLRDPELAPLISDEGVINGGRY